MCNPYQPINKCGSVVFKLDKTFLLFYRLLLLASKSSRIPSHEPASPQPQFGAFVFPVYPFISRNQRRTRQSIKIFLPTESRSAYFNNTSSENLRTFYGQPYFLYLSLTYRGCQCRKLSRRYYGCYLLLCRISLLSQDPSASICFVVWNFSYMLLPGTFFQGNGHHLSHTHRPVRCHEVRQDLIYL